MADHLSLYRHLIAEVEQAMAPLLGRHRKTSHCAPRCADCCQALTLLAIEAFLVQQAFRALPPEQQRAIRGQAEHPGDQCPFLLDALCAIYPARPLLCRTHGLAIAYVDEEREAIEVSACPQNFASDFPFTTEELLFLDPFNARLAALNRAFAEAMGLAAATRLAMRDTILTESLR